MDFKLLRKLLFLLDPECAHHVGMFGLNFTYRAGISRLFAKSPQKFPIEAMGLDFPNPVGLAAGLDKNGEYIDALAALGFGFIEVGTVTPRPQSGNPRPRMFRIPEKEAIINRMGFNNQGVDQLLVNISKARFTQLGGILGVNIGKNADTPIEKAVDDYLDCLTKVYNIASYVAINISSPNTKNLRELQNEDALDTLLLSVKEEQKRLADRHGKYVPMALKIAPDLHDDQIESVASLLKTHRIDGVIATNTTLSREGVESFQHAAETGGLSGRPVFPSSTEILRKLAALLSGEIPIIGVGGIMNGDDAAAKIEAGGNLVQLFTGFIYQGPELVNEAVTAIARLKNDSTSKINDSKPITAQNE